MAIPGTSYEVLEAMAPVRRQTKEQRAAELVELFKACSVEDWLIDLAAEGMELRVRRIAHVVGAQKWGVAEEDRERDWWMCRAIFNHGVSCGDITGGPELSCGLWCDDFQEFYRVTMGQPLEAR